jgi:hypothetical protein
VSVEKTERQRKIKYDATCLDVILTHEIAHKNKNGCASAKKNIFFTHGGLMESSPKGKAGTPAH